MIDKTGYRAGVGIILVNKQRRVFLAKRVSMLAWQFPQGGMHPGETPEEAMFRELKEEIGLNADDVDILSSTKRWLKYRLPQRMIRHHAEPLCIGQKQKWFLLRIKNENQAFDFHCTATPEFDDWSWVSYWYPLRQVIAFKRRVYVLALKEFAKIVLSNRFNTR